MHNFCQQNFYFYFFLLTDYHFKKLICWQSHFLSTTQNLSVNRPPITYVCMICKHIIFGCCFNRLPPNHTLKALSTFKSSVASLCQQHKILTDHQPHRHVFCQHTNYNLWVFDVVNRSPLNHCWQCRTLYITQGTQIMERRQRTVEEAPRRDWPASLEPRLPSSRSQTAPGPPPPPAHRTTQCQ